MKKEVRETYELISEWYDKRYTGRSACVYGYEEGLFRKHLDLADGDWILDLGTGTGRFAMSVVGTNAAFIGIDFSKTMIKFAKKKYSEAENVEFIVADAENLPFRPLSLDKVVSIGMFEYLAQPQAILSEVQYVLKEKGLLLLSVWNKFGIMRLVLMVIRELLEKTTVSKNASFTSKQFGLHLEGSGFGDILVQGYFFFPPSLLQRIGLNALLKSVMIARLDEMLLFRKMTSHLFFSTIKLSRQQCSLEKKSSERGKLGHRGCCPDRIRH